ncbi:CS1-pili formation C-terminal domain-containing protein [Vibrio jasicida]|uniref:CS1-pili formation C-terminal domain-containing protein n=1 Tax=Vibrio jasicida TaxID=766224 RepID=UPI0040695950
MNTASISPVLLLVMSTQVAASDLPEGFEEFYQTQDLVIELVLAADKTKRHTVNASVAGDSVTVAPEEIKALNETLIETFGVNSGVAERIEVSLSQGVQSSYDCKGFRSECGLIPETYDFVYVPDQQVLYLHVNSDYLQSVEARAGDEFINESFAESALISAHSLNISSSAQDYDRSNSYNTKANYQNVSVLGLKEYGHLYSDIALDTDLGFSGKDISYNYLNKDKKVSVGYKYNDSAWNNTSFLNDNLVSGYMVQFGNSDELKKEQESNRRIYFNVPRAGRLEVTDEIGRFLVSKNVEMGQTFISYNDLPAGTYTITVRVYDGNEDVYRQNFLIRNNNKSYQGRLDYMLTGGYLSRDLINTDDSRGSHREYEDYDSPAFVNGRATLAVTNSITLGGGALATIDDNFFYTGTEVDLGSRSNLAVTLGRFDNDDILYSADAYFDRLSFTYEKYEKEERNSSDEVHLSDVVSLGSADRETISANFNYNFTNSISYIASAVKNKYKSVPGDNIVTSEFDNTTIKNALYFSDLPLRATMNIQHDYIMNDDRDDEQQVFVNVSVPLGDDGRTTYTHSSGGLLGNSNTIRHNDSVSTDLVSQANANVNVRVGAQYGQKDSQDNLYDASLAANYNNDIINTNAYAYINSDGSASLSGFLGSNTIITKDDAIFTREKSKSYFISNNRTGIDFDEGNSFLAVVDSKVNDKNGLAYAVSKTKKAYPLKDYREYQFNLDTSASDFYNSGENNTGASSYPGTVIKLTTALGEIKSFISTFSDIEGKPVHNVECVGHGCVSTDELTEGVYQFRVKTEEDYRIISYSDQCVIPSLARAEDMNLGNNFCMPPFEETLDGHQIAYNDTGEVYYYIGRFQGEDVINDYSKRLEDADIDVITKKTDDYTYLFLKSTTLLVDRRKGYIEELMSYAIKDEATPYASAGE